MSYIIRNKQMGFKLHIVEISEIMNELRLNTNHKLKKITSSVSSKNYCRNVSTWCPFYGYIFNQK